MTTGILCIVAYILIHTAYRLLCSMEDWWSVVSAVVVVSTIIITVVFMAVDESAALLPLLIAAVFWLLQSALMLQYGDALRDRVKHWQLCRKHDNEHYDYYYCHSCGEYHQRYVSEGEQQGTLLYDGTRMPAIERNLNDI